MSVYDDLAVLASTTIQADFTSQQIPISPALAGLLAALDTRTGCWSDVFTSIRVFVSSASEHELLALWLALVKVCLSSNTSLAAYPLFYAVREDKAKLLFLWQSLPVGALPALRVDLASNPRLLSALMPPPSALIDPKVAVDKWTRVFDTMVKLSLMGPPEHAPLHLAKGAPLKVGSSLPSYSAVLDVVTQRVPDFSDARRADIANSARSLLGDPFYQTRGILFAVKTVIARSYAKRAL
jgi:hypothetical protein